MRGWLPYVVVGVLLSLGGCRGYLERQEAEERQQKQQQREASCQNLANIAVTIVDSREKRHEELAVVLLWRSEIYKRLSDEHHMRMFDLFLTSLIRRIYASQPPWSKADAYQRVILECDGVLLRALGLVG